MRQGWANGKVGIQSTNPRVYEALTKELTEDEKRTIQAVFQEAEQKTLEDEARAVALGVANGN
jgi:hypothetical protein